MVELPMYSQGSGRSGVGLAHGQIPEQKAREGERSLRSRPLRVLEAAASHIHPSPSPRPSLATSHGFLPSRSIGTKTLRKM